MVRSEDRRARLEPAFVLIHQIETGLCERQGRKKLIAEHALRDSRKPIGVSAFTLTKALPAQLKGTLPTVKELEEGLDETKVGVTGRGKGVRLFTPL